MRAAFVCALVVAGILAGTAGGQTVQPTTLAEDPAGDARIRFQGHDVPDARWPEVDLRFLRIVESQLSFVFTLGVESVPFTDPARQLDYGHYQINMSVGGTPYAIEAFQTSPDYIWASLCSKQTSEGPCDEYEQIGAAVEAASNSFVFALDKRLLHAAGGRALHQGDLLADVVVTAQRHLAFVEASGPRDRMPDEGDAAASWRVQYGPSNSGPIMLTSPSPLRLSNGVATTYVFEVNLTNTATSSEVITVDVQDVPAHWLVNIAVPQIELGPQESYVLPVLATVPFRHDHGRFVSFDVVARTESAHANIELGVLYSRVPQPAGHHDTLWLHEDSSRFMNAAQDGVLPDEERTFPPPLAPCELKGPRGTGFSEMIPLVPGLQIGLDAQMEKQGVAKLLLRSDVEAPKVSVSGYLQVWGEGVEPSICPLETPDAAIMELPQSAAMAFPAGESVTMELPIVPLPRGELLPYQPGLHMGLLLIIWNEDPVNPHLPVQVVVPGAGLPQAVAGSSFELALNEYHDPVGASLGDLPGASLAAPERERMVNAGETVLFQARMQNHEQSKHVVLELTGSNRHWASIIGAQSLRLGQGDERDFFVSVTAPSTASEGEVADLVLHVVDSTDPRQRGLVRFVATVDTSQDWPDEGDRARDVAGSRESTPFAGILLVPAMAWAAMWRRRSA